MLEIRFINIVVTFNNKPQKCLFTGFFFSQEKIQIETARLYKLAGVNPLAGV